MLIEKIMMEFAKATGLSPVGNVPRRYLWTDAFALCNFLELYRQTNDEKYRQLALDLVDQVHYTLGRHREDDPRTGWISGLSEEEGKMHPTRGGLRIGKAKNERETSDPHDEHLEWDQDGQYYHYLTKWMHALNRLSRITGCATYNIWAIELAKTAHAGFTYDLSPGGFKRIFWKMSIDLSRPLVTSMGHHDPLDGFITYYELQATASNDFKDTPQQDLHAEIADMAAICEGIDWATNDPLGIGGLLCDAYRAGQLVAQGNIEQTKLLEILVDSSFPSLEAYAGKNPLNLPADYRLAFRELGLSIGLQAIERLAKLIRKNPDRFKNGRELHARVESLMRYAPLKKAVEKFWLERTNQEAATWVEHRDINMVMLATSLAPDGFLTL